MASMANALNEIAGFGMVNAAARKVHAGIRTLRLQTAKAVLVKQLGSNLCILIGE